MLPAKEAKEKIRTLLGEQIGFEGHFELVFEQMGENLQQHFFDWITQCRNREINPDPSPVNHDILAFFFKPNVTNIRGILTKRKNSYFIVLFLDKHKYYDTERRKLGFR